MHTDARLVDYSLFKQSIDLVAGGPPCQPFSLGGKHQGFNDDRDMFPEAVRAIRELRPRAFMFENVKGLLRTSFAAYFEYILLQLTYPELTRHDAHSWMEHKAAPWILSAQVLEQTCKHGHTPVHGSRSQACAAEPALHGGHVKLELANDALGHLPQL